MKRKLLYLLLPLIPIFIGLFLILYFNIPRLEYVYNEEYDGYLVSRAFGDNKEYVIDATYNGKKIIGFSTRAFYKHNSLERIVFKEEENIQIIGRLSFSECYNLKEISIKNVTLIEKNAFAFCESLVSIETSAENIGASAFYGCKSLNEVTLNTGVRSIGSYCFTECLNLSSLKIPVTVKDIYKDCFSNSGIKDLLVPNHLSENPYIMSLENVRYY